MLKELFSIFGTVSINNQNANKSLDETTNKGKETAQKLSKGFETVGNVLEKVGTATVKVGKVCTAATAGIVAGLSTAVKRYDTLKNYPKVLSNLGFSAEDAKKSIDDLSNGIDGLPTTLDDAASGVQRLVAKNGDINKSTKYFLALNDAIVAGNAPTEQQASAIEQLTQAYSKGKPDLMEWRTLTMAMPGQLKQIAKSMGYVSTDALYEALSKGKISMDKFMDAIVKLDKDGADGIISFKEQARNSCDSIGTSITNLGNGFKKGFATILGSMDNAAKNTSFGSIAGMINNFSTGIKNFLDKIGGAVEKNEAFKKFLEDIAGYLTKLNDKINNLSPEQLDKIVTAIVKMVKAGPALLIFGKSFETVGKSFKGLSTGIKNVQNLSSALKIFKFISGGVSGTLLPLIGIVVAVASVVLVLKENWDKVTQTFKNFSNNIGIAEKIQEIKDKIHPLLEKLKPLKDLFEVIGTNIIIALQPALSVLAGLFNGVLSAIAPIIDALGGIIDILGGIGTFIKSVFTGDWQSAWESVKKIGSGIVEVFKGLWNAVKAVLSGFIKGFVDWWKALFDATGVTDLLIKVKESIVNWWNSVLSWLNDNIVQKTKVVFNKLVEGIKTAWDFICNIVEVAFIFIGNIISAAVNIITLPFRFIWENCKEYVHDAFSWIQERINIAISIIKTIVNIGFNYIKEKIINPINEAKNRVVEYIGALKNQIKEKINKIKEIISQQFTEIRDRIQTKVEEIKQKISDKFNEIKEKILTPINNAKQTIIDNFEIMKSKISEKIESTKNIISEKFTAIKDKALKPIIDMKNTISNTIDRIKEKFNSFTAKFKMPHFKVSGTMNPMDWISDHSTIPKLNVEWYAKAMNNPMLLNKPTAFGISPAGSLRVGGENGQEVVSGATTLMNMISTAVKSQNIELSNGLQKLIDILLAYFPQFAEMKNVKIVTDDGTVIGYYTPKINEELRRLKDKEERGS